MKLTSRETEIIAWLAMGYSTKETAHSLFISFHTARAHIRNIYQKTGAQNLADITRYYFTTNFPQSLNIAPRVKFICVMVFLLMTCRMAVQTSYEMLRVRTRTAQTRSVSSAKPKVYKIT